MSGEVADDVGGVSSPESLDSLLGVNSRETVCNSGVAGNFARLNSGVGILSLDDKFHTFDWGRAGFGDSARDTTRSEIRREVDDVRIWVGSWGSCFVGHLAILTNSRGKFAC